MLSYLIPWRTLDFDTRIRSFNNFFYARILLDETDYG
jgi:hypothetical protein